MSDDRPTLIVANSAEQARCQMERAAPERLSRARIIDTHQSDGSRILGALYPPEDIILTEGWEFGRNARHVEDTLRRNLAARGHRFEDCTRVEGDALTLADAAR